MASLTSDAGAGASGARAVAIGAKSRSRQSVGLARGDVGRCRAPVGPVAGGAPLGGGAGGGVRPRPAACIGRPPRERRPAGASPLPSRPPIGPAAAPSDSAAC